MADLQFTTGRASPRIDFTPMVDLGFLLITFFMLTTALAKPTVMSVVMPETDLLPDPPAVKSSQVLTLLLGANNQIFAYEGLDTATLDTTDFAQVRQLILNKKQRVQTEWGDENHAGQPVSKLTVLIKPTPQSHYANVVDVLDEMKICRIGHYLLLDPTPQELSRLQSPNHD